MFDDGDYKALANNNPGWQSHNNRTTRQPPPFCVYAAEREHKLEMFVRCTTG